MAKVKTVKSLSELMALIVDKEYYIRYTSNISADIRRGYSLNHATGQSESGLSVNDLFADTPEVWAGKEKAFVAMQVADYSFMFGGKRAWVVSGAVVGHGSDNEPLITNAQVIAEVTADCIAECKALWEEYHEYYMWRIKGWQREGCTLAEAAAMTWDMWLDRNKAEGDS